MNKKNFVYLFFISVFSFLLFSCVDYIQTISYKDGKYTIYYKITLSKLLLELADEEPDSIFDDFDFGDFSDYESLFMPKNMKINKVNTDLEVGAEFKISISARTQDEAEKKLLPTVAKNKIKIPVFFGDFSAVLNEDLGDSYSDDFADEFVQAIFSAAKSRVLIGKNIVPSIEICYFEGKGGQNYSIPLFDYGESWCLEIPFIVFFETEMYDFENIVIIKKEAAQ